MVAERAALAPLPEPVKVGLEERFVCLDGPPTRERLESLAADRIPLLDPVGERRNVQPGESGPADAGGAIAALDVALDLVGAGVADALVTAPLSKESIARHHLPDFRGHTDYLARRAGLTRYGRDYLMTFLAPDLQVALLTTHLPLSTAISEVSQARILAALELLHNRAGGRIAVAGLNPHAGERGLMGEQEGLEIRPALAEARQAGIDAAGPASPDSVFARARRGEFDWVLALYHDQGLIAVKTVAFGMATNWTLGLPFLRTSVDHGTAFEIAGRGVADPGPMLQVIDTTLRLIAGELPRGK